MNYLIGIMIALLSKMIISLSNVLDGKISRSAFFSVGALVTINGILLIPALWVLFLVLQPTLISKSQLYIIMIISMIEFAYQIPYYLSLKEIDTSIVIALFSLEKMFIPILAYIFIGERLSTVQYLGFILIISFSLLLTYQKQSYRLNKAVYLMTFVCLLLGIDSILEKYSLNTINWSTFYFWTLALSTPFYFLIPLFIKSSRTEIFEFLKSPLNTKYHSIYYQNIASWTAGGLDTIALSLLPVTVFKGIAAFQAVFVYFYSNKGSHILNIDKRVRFTYWRIPILFMIGIGTILTLL